MQIKRTSILFAAALLQGFGVSVCSADVPHDSAYLGTKTLTDGVIHGELWNRGYVLDQGVIMSTALSHSLSTNNRCASGFTPYWMATLLFTESWGNGVIKTINMLVFPSSGAYSNIAATSLIEMQDITISDKKMAISWQVTCLPS